PGLAVNSIPLAGQGVPMSPVLADVDGDHRDEVAVASFTGEPELYRGDGTRMTGAGGQSHFDFTGTGAGSRATAPSVVALGANAAFGRITRGGPLGLFGGVVDSRIAAAQSAPAAGDVDGGGRDEVVAVTRDGYLYVWNTPARAGSMREWPSFRHDARNTGRFG